MKFKRIISVVLSTLMLASVASVATSAASESSANPYEQQAARYDQKKYDGNDLGATYSKESTTFKVWSPAASSVKLNLYKTGTDKEEGAENIGSYDMAVEGDGAVWTYTVPGDQKNVYYTYTVVSAAYADGVEVADVYAKAAGANGDRSMVVDLAETNPEGWDTDNFINVNNQTDANVWELHVKDFSYDKSSGISEANRGKYLAFTEKNTTLNGEGKFKTGVSYIADMGFNYVHINPFYDFGSIDETGSDDQFNWGYDPKNYNVPEGSYSSDPYDGNVRINETKQMVQSLHEEGIGVIMDVVYNHTFVQDSWLQKTVPDYYYRIKADGTWSNGSGCGNDTASERAMFKKYMVDSVVYWATEYHIDGFRFDLMGLHDVDVMNAIRKALDQINPDIIIYGEGWTMGSEFDSDAPDAATQANSSKLSTRIAFFNDQQRDGIKGSVFDEVGKGFIQGAANGSAIALGLQANTTGGNWTAQQPEQTVSYASCHDNATLYDRLVNSLGGDFTTRYDDYVQRNKLSAAIVYGSQGTSFVLAGEEFARTKLGDHNSYKSSPDLNKLDWNRTVEYADLVAYYKGLMEFRAVFDPVRTPTKLTNVTVAQGNKNTTVSAVYKDTGSDWNTVAMLFNGADIPQTVELGENLPANWVVVVNDTMSGTAKLGEVSGSSIEVPANSALFLVDKESYDTAGISDEKGVVEVKHIDAETNEVMSTTTLFGEIGANYQTMSSGTYDLFYDLVGASENVEGVFTEEKIVVEYRYRENLLRPQDITGDDKIDLQDVLKLKKSVAKYFDLTEDEKTKSDVNLDGVVDLHDILYYQKYVAKYPMASGVGTVTINYLDQDGKSVSPSTVKSYKIGQPYEVTAKEISYYKLDESKLPENAKGTVKAGNTDVNYYFNYEALTSKIQVKVPDGETWVPNLYVWEDVNGTTVESLGSWPGGAMTLVEDNVYEISFSNGGNYNWIVNSAAGQTGDFKGYAGDWYIVMKDATTVESETPLN